MPYTFRMVFTGLCAFKVREDDICAVLVDARDPRANHHGGSGGHGHGSTHPSHAPVVQFFLDDVDSRSSRGCDLGFRGALGKREQGLCFLDRHELALLPLREEAGALVAGPALAKKRPVIWGGRAAGTNKPRNSAEEADAAWISELGKLEAGLQTKAGVFKEVPDDAVVARLVLQDGAFGTQFVGRSRGGTPTIASFVDGAEAHPSYADQALAETVAYEVRVDDSSPYIALSLRKFASDLPTRLVFSFRGQPSGHAIQVFVKNMPLSDILEISPLIRTTTEDANVDTHFNLYHALLEKSPQRNWLPAWLEVKNGNPWCPDTMLP
jgi:hypothetical protein